MRKRKRKREREKKKERNWPRKGQRDKKGK